MLPIVATGILTLASLALAPTVATADPLDDRVEYCWTDVDTAEVACVDGGYDEMVEQIEKANGGPLIASSTDAPPNDDEFVPRAAPTPLATYLLVIVYDQTSFNGNSMSYVTTSSSICATTQGFPNLGSWNDRIDSFQSFNGCSTVLYRDANYGTPSYGPYVSSSDVGSMKHNASSMIVG